MKIGKIVEKIEKRVSSLEEIAGGSKSKLDWEQVIFSDEEYEVTLLRDYYDEAGFYLLINKEGENAAVSLEEVPESVLEEVVEVLYFPEIEEAIIDTVNEA